MCFEQSEKLEHEGGVDTAAKLYIVTEWVQIRPLRFARPLTSSIEKRNGAYDLAPFDRRLLRSGQASRLPRPLSLPPGSESPSLESDRTTTSWVVCLARHWSVVSVLDTSWAPG